MMRSMYSGVSGLRAHQAKMDIIGNNIANVNTVGFKGQRVTFQEVFSQTLRGAGSPQQGRGGTNPQQVGLGISLSSIDTMHVRGAVQRTDNNTDLSINGDGFFIISNSSDYLNRSFTRAGNFTLDNDGNLVASNGYKVLGYMVDKATGELKSNLEGVKISKSESDDAKATSFANFEGNLDNVLPKISATATYTPANGAVKESVNLGANTKYWETTYQFIDGLGGKHNIKFTFVRGLKADGSPTDANDETSWGVMMQDLENGRYFNKTGANATGTAIGDVIVPIKFDPSGKLITNDANFMTGMTLQVPGKNGANIFPVKVDFNKLTQFNSDSNAAITSSDGYPQGFLDTFSIGPTGEINGVFTNGQNKVIGRLALAVFKNPAGLEKTSENMYQTTPNSGDAVYGLPASGGLGALSPGTLEMSNVDISREFTEMISTQRGFQANSRIITASDEMLQELVNMKR